MAVKDIVAGAEMFLRTAGIADENIRRQLLQRVQQQALQKGEMDLQNLQGAQNYTTNFFDTQGKANQVGADYAPPGMSPEGMVGKPDMNEYLKGLLPFMDAKEAAVTTINMGTKETPEQKFMKDVYLARIKAQGQKGPSTAIAKFIEDNPYATSDEIADYHKKLQKDPASTNVHLQIGDKGLTKLSEEMGKNLAASHENAKKVVGSMYNLQQSKQLLNNPMITGAGANYLLALGKGLSQLGIHFSDDAIANTEAFAASMGNQVGTIIKQFGAGTGLSDADRDYAEKIVGGKITLNKQSIEKIIGILERGMSNVIEDHNRTAKEVMAKPEAKDLPYSLIVENPMSKKIGRFEVREK